MSSESTELYPRGQFVFLLPIVAAIIPSTIMMVVIPAIAGYPVTTADVKFPALFFVVSLIFLAITWRAHRRVTSTSRAPLSMRLAPGLVIGGFVLGVGAGWWLGTTGIDIMNERVDELCDYVTRDHKDLRPACRAQGKHCLAEGADLVDRRWNRGLERDEGSPVSDRREMFTA